MDSLTREWLAYREEALSMINPRIVAALDGTDIRPRAAVAALRVFSVLRGPDSEDLDLKQWYTTPIRMYVAGETLYDNAGYTQKVKRLAYHSESEWKHALTKASELYRAADRGMWPSPNLHYIGHVCQAIAAIAYLEGWSKDATEQNQIYHRYFH